MTELSSSYRMAEAVARSRARNFYYSFLALPAEKRRAFCAVYAFMRDCDDISDGPCTVEAKSKMLGEWRARLDNSLEGSDDNPILPAFRDSVERFQIPLQYFHWIIDGTEMDLTKTCYGTFEDLYRYCFHVASAVGFVCLQIFGYREQTAKEYAESCGVAFQLTNILRDLKEDAQRGRVYLPLQDLQRFRYTTSDLQNGVQNDQFRQLMDFEAERAHSYYRKARNLLPLIDRRSRPTLWAMIEIYERILKKIVRRHYDVFAGRVRLSAGEKTTIALRAIAMRAFPEGQA